MVRTARHPPHPLPQVLGPQNLVEAGLERPLVGGRGGARVMTSIASLAPGDIVHLEEVGGPFKTRAEVRGSYVGKDRIRRLNLRFLDSPAPDYLVHVDEGGTGGRRR